MPVSLKPLEVIVAELEAEYGGCFEPGKLLLMTAGGKDPLYPDRIVSSNLRIDAQKAIIKYMRPALNNIEVTGAGGGPITTAALPVDKLMSNDKVVDALEEIIIDQANKVRARQEQEENA